MELSRRKRDLEHQLADVLTQSVTDVVGVKLNPDGELLTRILLDKNHYLEDSITRVIQLKERDTFARAITSLACKDGNVMSILRYVLKLMLMYEDRLVKEMSIKRSNVTSIADEERDNFDDSTIQLTRKPVVHMPQRPLDDQVEIHRSNNARRASIQYGMGYGDTMVLKEKPDDVWCVVCVMS